MAIMVKMLTTASAAANVRDRGRPRRADAARRRAGARPREDSRSVQVESRRHLSERGRLARRERQAAGRAAAAAAVPGQAGLVGLDAGRRARHALRIRQGTVAPVRLRQHARPIRTRATQPHQGMRQEMVQLARRLRRRGVVHRAGGAAVPAGLVEKFITSEARLKPYEFYLERHRAPRRRTRSRKAKRRSSPTPGPLASSPSSIYGILSNADFPYPTVTLSDGKSVKLDQAAFATLRGLPNRDDRQKVMSAFFGALGGFSRHLRHDDEQRGAESAVLREGQKVSGRRSKRRSTARTSRSRSTRD